jgi:hypothetical protein
MRRHMTLFARYGLPNPKALRLVRDLRMKAFTSQKRGTRSARAEKRG